MTAQEQIDDCLSVRDGHLFIEDCDTVELADRFGTPVFVISETQLRMNTRRFKAAFAASWPGPVDLLPANKANWNTAVRTILTAEETGADVYSEGELESALACHVEPIRISVSGGGKSEALIRRCIQAGVRITVEDLDEPELIDRVAKELGKRAKIRLRVKPSFPNLWKLTDFAVEFVSIDLGLETYKAGIPVEYLKELGQKVLALPNVDLMGFHFHSGRHAPSLWYWRGLMSRYARLILELCEAWGGYRPSEIDIGGGYASSRDPHNKLGIRGSVLLTLATYPLELLSRVAGEATRYRMISKLFEFVGHEPTKKRAPTIEDYGDTVVRTLRSELEKGGMDLSGVRLQLEPGRSLYGDTGIHLTRVKKFKQQTRPIKHNWVLTDTTYFFLSGGVYELNAHDFRIANKADQRGEIVADIVGHSCYADRILPFAKVPPLDTGDLIAFLDMGAYQEVSASNFNALPRPGMVLVSGSNAEFIKVPESIADVYRRDRVPARLRRAKTERSPRLPTDPIVSGIDSGFKG